MERWGLYKQVSSLGGGGYMRVINHFYVPQGALLLSLTCVLPCEVFLSQRADTSLSLSLCTSALINERLRGAAVSVKHRYCDASLILHASITKITAHLLSLSYVYLISSDDGIKIQYVGTERQTNVIINKCNFYMFRRSELASRGGLCK